MADIVLGIFAIIAGGVMLFAGQYVLRVLLPIWGFFAGFAFGAGLFAGLADERFLGSVLGWISGFVFALIFALFAYLCYAVAVILAMAAFGFAIGAGLVMALGIDWNWVAVLVGVFVGAVVGLVSVVGNMPMIVLAVLSSIAGGVSVVGGLMLMVGSLNSSDFTQASFTQAVNDSWGWYPTLLVLILAGIVAQIRQRATWRRTVRETWYVENACSGPAAPVDTRSPASGEARHTATFIRSRCPSHSGSSARRASAPQKGGHGWTARGGP